MKYILLTLTLLGLGFQQPSRPSSQRPSSANNRRQQRPITGQRQPPTMVMPNPQEIFQRLDINHDGVLDYDEMPETLKENFFAFDFNENGVIDQEEYQAYMEARFQSMVPSSSTVPVVQPLPLPQPPLPPPSLPVINNKKGKKVVEPTINPLLLQYDLNHDKQISFHEWLMGGGDLQEFIKRDRNNDGFLEGKELW